MVNDRLKEWTQHFEIDPCFPPISSKLDLILCPVNLISAPV